MHACLWRPCHASHAHPPPPPHPAPSLPAGLKSHPQHELAKRQTTGMSGMVSFHLRGGKPEARAFLKALKVFTLAESLGAVESLAEVP